MPLILGTNSIKDTGFDVANSLRFDDGSTDNLTKTFASASNRKTWTYSAWVKRSELSDYGTFFVSRQDANNQAVIRFVNDDTLDVYDYVSDVFNWRLQLNRKFRDVSAWYHIVISRDTTQATASDRVKIYVNGVQETSFATSTYPSLNYDGFINNTDPHSIGSGGANNMLFDGYMAEVCFIDGQQLDPTSFGEFDEDTGIWKPIDVSGLTFGTNGFYLDFENSGSLGADVSGNGNNFTVNNLTSIDQTTDTPTNNYATLNPLDNDSNTTFSEGNTKFVTDSVERRPFYSTYGLTTGKWYWEVKGTVNTSVGYLMIGIAGSNNTATEPLGNNLYDYSYRPDSGNIYNNSSLSSYGNTFTDNDIIGIALDLDNNKLYFSKNGTFQNSGDPTSGATGTGAVSITDPSSTDKGCYIPSASDFWTGGGITGFFNFGNPAFTISSGNSDGNGKGNFEYAVPSGYFALCTSNLAEHG